MLEIIDVGALFDSGSTLAERRAVGQKMVSAAESLGFLLIQNYAIPAAEIDTAFAQAKIFFAQPMAYKKQIDIKNSSCHRGYFSIGSENLDPQKQKIGDFKEGMKIGQDLALDHPLVKAGLPLHGPNQWPDDAEFVAAMQGLYQTLSAAAQTLLRGISLGLDLAEDYFDKAFALPMATLAPLRYPSKQQQSSQQDALEGNESLGAGEHTDFGCLTLVMQNQIEGLQVKTVAGEWIDVPFLEDTIVVNIGDMLQRWSNDRLRSTWHRVGNPAAVDRYSMAFFYEPEHGTLLDCLPSCRSAERPFQYEVVTALDYLLKRIEETFSYYKKKR
jgi:isopenicillin N synthase-like dioxygenase